MSKTSITLFEMLYQLKQEILQLFNGIDTDGSEDLSFSEVILFLKVLHNTYATDCILQLMLYIVFPFCWKLYFSYSNVSSPSRFFSFQILTDCSQYLFLEGNM